MALTGSSSTISGLAMNEAQTPTDNGPATDRILRPPLAQQVADRIVEAIASGAVQSGQRVTDSDIAARFGVSRNPVREAMKILELALAAGGETQTLAVGIIDQLGRRRYLEFGKLLKPSS